MKCKHLEKGIVRERIKCAHVIEKEKKQKQIASLVFL
jgi:hypothetical protein